MKPRSTIARLTVAVLVAAAVAFTAGYAPVREHVAATGLYSAKVAWLYPLMTDGMFVLTGLVFLVAMAMLGRGLAQSLLMVFAAAVNIVLCLIAPGAGWVRMVAAAAFVLSTILTFRVGVLLRAAPPSGVRG